MECMQVEDAWICSACLRLVNGNPGPALASKLGWTAPLAAPTLAAQLLELGKLHSQVPMVSLYCPCHVVKASINLLNGVTGTISVAGAW